MQITRHLLALSLLCMNATAQASELDESIQDTGSVSPYYQVDPALILETLKQRTAGKINNINNLTMYAGKDRSTFQFCTPKENKGHFVYGYIAFDLDNTTIEWSEFPLKTELGARAECDTIARQGEARLVEFELSAVAGLSCISSVSGVFCKPYI